MSKATPEEAKALAAKHRVLLLAYHTDRFERLAALIDELRDERMQPVEPLAPEHIERIQRQNMERTEHGVKLNAAAFARAIEQAHGIGTDDLRLCPAGEMQAWSAAFGKTATFAAQEAQPDGTVTDVDPADRGIELKASARAVLDEFGTSSDALQRLFQALKGV